MSADGKTVLWWGRFDPDYSRNRILRQAYAALGWKIADFQPLLSPLGDIEARLRRPARTDVRPSPLGSHEMPTRGARFDHTVFMPELPGKPGSPG